MGVFERAVEADYGVFSEGGTEGDELCQYNSGNGGEYFLCD